MVTEGNLAQLLRTLAMETQVIFLCLLFPTYKTGIRWKSQMGLHIRIFQQCVTHSSPSVSIEALLLLLLLLLFKDLFCPYLSSLIWFSVLPVERAPPPGQDILRVDTDSSPLIGVAFTQYLKNTQSFLSFKKKKVQTHACYFYSALYWRF